MIPPVSLVAQMEKNLPAGQETQVRSLGWEDPLEKGMTTHSVFLPGKYHGQRSLAGYNLWGLKESDMTEVTNTQRASDHQVSLPAWSFQSLGSLACLWKAQPSILILSKPCPWLKA